MDKARQFPNGTDALREAANEMDQRLADAPNPSPDMRLWHGIFADFLRVKALDIEPVEETITLPVDECHGWDDGPSGPVAHPPHVFDWSADKVLRFCKGGIA